MGNAVCAGKNAGLGSICTGRGFPEFIAPNADCVTHSFDHAQAEHIRFLHGAVGTLSPQGFRLEPQGSERRAAKSYTVKEYSPNSVQLRLCVSGRVFVQCPDDNPPSSTPASACAFKVCTRGRPIYESVRTRTFTHTAQVVTSGVFCGLCIACSSQGLFLCPQLLLVLESGDEVMLVDDRLGPLQPQSFYVDFAVVDDGGRNVQVDLIFRGAPGARSAEEGGMRTLRTCLQDHTVFNSHVQPATICLGFSDLTSLLPASSVHLQNLVVSEEGFEEPVPEVQPYNFRKEAVTRSARAGSPRILYEGEDAHIAAMAIDLPEGPMAHPQLQSARHSAADSDNGLKLGGVAEPMPEPSCTSDFWHHVRYDEEADCAHMVSHNGSEYISRMRGEFWLSKEAVDKKHLYFHCSSTLAQALTMCIVFRFSCPPDYLQLIERAGGEAGIEKREACVVLRELHIPANGLVLGIEQDPRHHGLLRMFIEHRNEIKHDMVICGRTAVDMPRSIVHQEVYDGGGIIIYRVTLLHRNGARQSAVLQMNAEDFEDANLDSSGSQYRMMEEPSPRFPISPVPPTQNLSPANRIFVYSEAAYEQHRGSTLHADGSDGGVEALDELQSGEGIGTPIALHGTEGSYMSDATAEEWQSAGGGYSDCEPDVAHLAVDFQRAKLTAGSGSDEPAPLRAEWRRPLVESVVLLCRMEDPPFKCFPTNLS